MATISNANGSQGLASSASVGVTTIAATHAGTSVSGATTLTVLDGITLRGASSDGAANGLLSLGLATPSGTLSGDVLLAAIAIRPHTVTITAPAGWTLVRRVDNAATNQNSLAVYRRVAAASEPTTHTFTFSASSGSAGGIVAFYGVDTTTPVDVEAGQTTSSGLAHATPAVVTTVADAMVFTAHGFSSSATWTPPAGMTETFEAMSQASVSAAGVSVSGNHAEQAAAGSTGGRSAVASAHADVGNAVVVVLRPVP